MSSSAGRRLVAALGGAGLLLCLVSMLAGPLGIADEPGLGYRQLAGFAAGVAAIAAAALAHRWGPAALGPASLVLVLAVGTLYVQYRALSTLEPGQSAATLIEQGQLGRHERTLGGQVGDPWRFRLLSEWAVAAALRSARALDVWRPELAAFLGLRLLQNIALFALAWLLYRRLGASRHVAALGLCLVAWAMTQALYHAGLSYDTYSEVVLFLAGALLLLHRRYGWLVPLTAFAALNRETSGLIALMPLALAASLGLSTPAARRPLLAGAAALGAFALAIGAMRLSVGPGELILADGHRPGFDMLGYNVGRGITWANLFATVTAIPALALAALRRWPRELLAIALAVVPAWLVVHFLAAVAAETRLFLVPHVLVFVPGALAVLRVGGGDADADQGGEQSAAAVAR